MIIYTQNINITSNEFSKYLPIIKNFYNLFTYYTKKKNLGRIKDFDDFIKKHFLEAYSLFVVLKKYHNIEETNKTIGELGAGGGLLSINLSIILKINNLNHKILLIEKDKVKCAFLELVKYKLHLTNIEIMNKHIREKEKKPLNISLLYGRAFPNMEKFISLSVNLLEKRGEILYFVSYWQQQIYENKYQTYKITIFLESKGIKKDTYLLKIRG